jgi:hypothetical protein
MLALAAQTLVLCEKVTPDSADDVVRDRWCVPPPTAADYRSIALAHGMGIWQLGSRPLKGHSVITVAGEVLGATQLLSLLKNSKHVGPSDLVESQQQDAGALEPGMEASGERVHRAAVGVVGGVGDELIVEAEARVG